MITTAAKQTVPASEKPQYDEPGGANDIIVTRSVRFQPKAADSSDHYKCLFVQLIAGCLTVFRGTHGFAIAEPGLAFSITIIVSQACRSEDPRYSDNKRRIFESFDAPIPDHQYRTGKGASQWPNWNCPQTRVYLHLTGLPEVINRFWLLRITVRTVLVLGAVTRLFVILRQDDHA